MLNNKKFIGDTYIAQKFMQQYISIISYAQLASPSPKYVVFALEDYSRVLALWGFIHTYLPFCLFYIYILVCPQWWSFADVSQQGLDFSKKISKRKIFFWFDFHRCSQGLTKIRRQFRNKSCPILKLSTNVYYIQKMWS